MMYAGVGWAPSRNAVEANSRFASPWGSVRASAQLVTERADNARLEGLGCAGSRTCAPCEAKAQAERNQMARLGGWGLGAVELAVELRPQAQQSLLNIATYALQAVESLKAQDRGTTIAMVNAIAAQPDWGWAELAASKDEAVSSINAALAELDRAVPNWFTGAAGWMGPVPSMVFNWLTGVPPSQVTYLIGALQSVANRMHARAQQDDLSIPAEYFSTDEQSGIDEGEAAVAAGVAEQERQNRLQACNPMRVANGEISVGDYASLCGPKVDLSGLKLLGLAAAAIIGLGLFGRARG